MYKSLGFLPARGLKPVWQICEFNDDVTYGRLDQSKFAVELHSVLDGTADPIYTDPELFLKNTYPTSNMQYLVREALRRLSGRAGQPVFILDTEFGGGKTHSLILLLHLFKNQKLGTNYIRQLGLHKESDILEVPKCKVVAIDCRKITKNTLWGEIADALGKYEDFKEEDLSKRPPRDISKLKALFDETTLLLIDELPDHLLRASAERIGNTDLSELTISFVVNLISAIAATRSSMLVLTLTGKQSLYERHVAEFKSRLHTDFWGIKIEEIDQMMKEALSRQAQYIVPVEKEEVSEVIRKRLIKSIDENSMNDVVSSYYNYFSEKGMVVDLKYEDRMRKCYPFHPFLIDILYDRVSTIDEFNKTRGVLRLLALVLHRILRDKEECFLVSAGDVPLDDPEIKDELTSRLGRSYFRPVVETDCVEKARELDKKKMVKIAEKVARCIYLYSLIGAPKISGIKPGDVKLAICSPGIDPSLVEKTLDELDEELWYLKSEAGAYYFDKEPNINKIIHDYKNEVRSSEIRDKIKETLKALLPEGEGIKTVVWDRSELRDDEVLKLFVVDYREFLRDGERILNEILETREGGAIRTYRNTLTLLVPEKEAIPTLEDTAKMLCAIEKAKKDERVKLDKERIKKINERLESTSGALTSDCLQTHLKIAYPRPGDGKLYVDTIPFSGKTTNLTDCVLNHLRQKGKLVENLSPEALKDIISEKKKLRLEELYRLFKTDRARPFIASGKVIIEAVRTGVLNKRFGYAAELKEIEGKYEAKIGEYVNPSWQGWIIDEELIFKRREEEEGQVTGPRPLPPSPLGHRYEIVLSNLADTIDKLRKVKVVSTGRKMEITFSLDIWDEKKTTSISIGCRDQKRLSELERIIEQLSRDYSGNGSLVINSEDDIKEELANLGVEWV